MLFDHEFWKRWEAQRIDAKFSLDRLTYSEGSRAIYETQFRERAAVIQFFAGDSEDIASRRKRWRESAGLSHPALVEIFERGETALGDARCAYIATERADESLSEVLGDRTLTADETRDMLSPLLGVLRYLHERGFAHGELKPANIRAFGNQLKVSSDSLTPGGDTTADCTAIGALVNQVLGGNMPEPFSEIAKQSNIAAMEACLRGEPAKSGTRWKWWTGGTVAIAGAMAFWPCCSSPPAPPAPAPVAVEPAPPKPAPVEKPSPTNPPPAKPTEPAPPKPAPAKTTPVQNLEGITQVMPEIPERARGTITGRVRINVRVRVDGSGSVTEATLDPPAASPYFSSRALTAARAWKFPAGGAPSAWVLRFQLMRSDSSVSVARVGN